MEPLPAALHQVATELYREYLLIGGMPACINAFLKGGSAALFGASFEWLNLAGVVLKRQRISQAFESIAVYADLQAFKLYMGDAGLLTIKSEISQQAVLSGEGNTIIGAVTENYVAQQMDTKGYDLYYWESGSKTELGFILQIGNQIIGIEVRKGGAHAFPQPKRFCEQL